MRIVNNKRKFQIIHTYDGDNLDKTKCGIVLDWATARSLMIDKIPTCKRCLK